jgi:hypothetical protein
MDPVPVPVPESVVAAAAAAPVANAAAGVGKLGSGDAKESEIEKWLFDDTKTDSQESGSSSVPGQAKPLHNETAVVGTQDQDTTPEFGAPAPDAIPQRKEEGADKVVEAEGGARIKIGSAKQKIEKTREDTSRAASDILRRMMERRPDTRLNKGM